MTFLDPGQQPSDKGPRQLPTDELASLGTRELPSAEDLLGPKPQAAKGETDDLPSLEDLLGPRPSEPVKPLTGRVADFFFTDPRSALTHIGDAFGQTLNTDLSDENLDIPKETREWLRKKGVWGDFASGHVSLQQAMIESYMRQGAMRVNHAIMAVPALVHAASAAVAQAGEETRGTGLERTFQAIGLGSPQQLTREVAAIPEAFPTFDFHNGIATTEQLRAHPVWKQIEEARDLKVIGKDGEAGWKGLHVAEPRTAAEAPREAAPIETPPAEAEAAAPAPSAPAFDIHAEARRIDPGTFDEFDKLERRRNTLRGWIEDPAIVMRPANLESSLRETEKRILELAPKVNAAYAEAGKGLPNAGRTIETPHPGTPAAPAAEAEAAPAGPQGEATVPAEGAPPARLAGAEEAQAGRTITPPVNFGFVRFYHGADKEASPPSSGGGRWVTSDPQYARRFRAGTEDKKVWYVDIPKGDPAEVAARAWDEIDERGGTNMVGVYRHVEVPEEWAKRMRPLEPTAEWPAGRTIDRTHDVPYLAGSSNDGTTTYIDKRVPAELTVKGVTFDPAKYLSVHEATEHGLMVDRGEPYETAHREALKAEQAAVEADGIDWKAYQEEMTKLVGTTEHEKAKTPPPDLYTKPYPHAEAEFLKREGEATPAAIPSPAAPIRSPQALWDELQLQRQAKIEASRVQSGYNPTTSRSGADLRARGTQIWEIGNTVDVGFVKDLLVTEAHSDGTFTLVSKPDSGGLSRKYNAKPHEGLVREKDTDFIEAAKPLIDVSRETSGKQIPPIAHASTIAQQRDYIIADMREQLRKVRKAEPGESEQTRQARIDAEAQLYASRMIERSQRFGGRRGTAEDLYRAEGIEIQKAGAIGKKVQRAGPGAVRTVAMAGERMAEGKKIAAERRAQGLGTGGTVTTEAQRYATMAKEDKEALKAAYEDEREALEPEEREGVPEAAGLMSDDDWEFMAEREAAGLPLFQRVNPETRDLVTQAKQAEADLRHALEGVEVGGGEVQPMDLALNKGLINRLPPEAKAAAERHAELSAAIDAKLEALDAQITKALQGVEVDSDPVDLMDIAVNRRLRESVPAEVQALMDERDVLTSNELAHRELFQGGTGKVNFAEKLPEDAEIERDQEHISDADGEAYLYDVAYTKDGDAVISNIRKGDEHSVAGPLDRMQAKRLGNEIAAGVQGVLEDRGAEIAENARWEALTPEQQTAETAAKEKRRADEGMALSERVNAAVDSALARGWRPEINQYGGWKRPPELEGFASPAANAAIRARLSQQGFPLFQRARGSFTLRENDRPLMELGRTQNASTVIHEFGHDFLEQLARDAEHPLAPDQLRSDWEETKKYLEIGSGRDIREIDEKGELTKKARFAHERFATAYEQWLMLGVAPSRALVRIFTQFRNWLLKVYDSYEALVKATPHGREVVRPLTPEMIQVFRRMHDINPDDTIIAPSPRMQPGLGDIHEARAEAAEALPSQAGHGVASEIQGERDSHAAANVVEEEHARLTDVEARTGERAPGTPQPPGHPDETGTQRGEAGGAAAPGEVVPGGGEAAAQRAGEGAGRAGEPLDKSAGVKTEPPPTANSAFAPNSKYTDKIGNFRTDGLNDVNDIFGALRENVEKSGGIVEQRRRGVPVTDGDRLNLGLASGLDPSWLDAKQIGDAYSSREIKALEQMLVTLSAAVKDASAAAETGDPAGILAKAEAMARLEMVQAHLAGASAEAGRSLGAVRRVVKKAWGGGAQKTAAEAAASLAAVRRLAAQKWESPEQLSLALKAETGRTLFQIQEMAGYTSRLDTPARVARLVADTSNGRMTQAIQFYYVNALLSGPITHFRYAIGNGITAMYAPAKTTVAATFDWAMYQAGIREQQMVFHGEAWEELWALTYGSRKAFQAGKEGWRLGNTPDLPGEVHPDIFGAQPIMPPIPGIWGQVIGTPGKLVGFIHGFGSQLRYEQGIAKLAYRNAMLEKLEGDAFKNRMAELQNRPTPEMMEQAAMVARKDLYMAPAEYGSFLANLSRVSDTNIITKVLMPFVKIGMNIDKIAVVEGTPAGLFAKKVRANLLGHNGQVAQAEQSANLIAGMGMMGMATLMVAEGMATGDGPNDPNLRREWLKTNEPNSIKVGPFWLSYKGLGAIGMQMRLAANSYEAGHGWGEDEHYSTALALLEGFEKAVLGESFMTGLKDMIEAMYHAEEHGERYIANMVTNWLPFSVGMGQMTKLFDPYERETHARTTLEQVGKATLEHIPFASRMLYPRRDSFGEPISAHGLNPSYANDPLVRAMSELHVPVAPIKHTIRGVQLTDAQYDEYAMKAGRKARENMNITLRTAGRGYRTFAPEERVRLINLFKKDHEEAVKEFEDYVMQKSIVHGRGLNKYGDTNDIMKQAIENTKVKKGIEARPVQH